MQNNNNNKVMSDEQMETLRMQIAVYNYICDMLADLHNYCLTLQPPLLPDLPLAVKVENTQQKEPLTWNCSQKWSSRRRWAPTREQIEILERLFEDGGGSHPNKQKIKEITAVLSRHGQISEANVYTWFQNRRARLKRKMQSNVEGVDHNNQQQMLMNMFPVDPLVSTSTSYNNNNNNKVESVSLVNNYVTF